MTVYIKVQDIEPDCCTGCCLEYQEDACLELRKRVSPGNNNMSVACPSCIWIKDTEAARLAYITLKLEN